MRFRHIIAGLFAVALLSGCAGSTTTSVGGSGVTYSTPSQQGDNLQGVEIRRIGNDQPRFREFQDRAVADALAVVDRSGIDRERIKNITVDTRGGEVSGGLRPIRTAPRYTVWLNIEGCERGVSFNASSTGRVASPSDPSGCLAPQP